MTLEFRIEPTKEITVLVSSTRAKRPKLHEKKKAICPFDPGNEKETPASSLEIATYSKPRRWNWKTRCFTNKFPFLTLDEKYQKNKENTGAYGLHEVIVETSKHNELFENFDSEQLQRVFETYVNRYKFFENTNGIEYVYLFKNHGKNAGASIDHEHSQILGLPLIPELIQKEFAHQKKCVYCALQKKNVVFENKEFVVVRPSFARFPLECWIIPKKHVVNFADFNECAAIQFMQIYQKIIRQIKKYTGDYNVAFHNSCKKQKIHFHVEIYPKTVTWGGIEFGTGLIGNEKHEKEALKLLRPK